MRKISSLILCIVLFVAALPATAQAAFDEAIRRYQTRDYRSAIALLQGLLAQNQSCAEYHYYAALCYQQLGNLPEAAKEYQWVSTNASSPAVRAIGKRGLEIVSKYSSAQASHARSTPLSSTAMNTSSTTTAGSPLPPQGSTQSQTARFPSSIGQDWLFIPTINLNDGRSIVAGKAWCAKLPSGQTALVTALHLLGPAGGLDVQIPPDRVAAAVNSVDLVSIDGNVSARTTTTLTKSGKIREDDDCSGDVVFFLAPSSLAASKAFSISRTPAAIGQRCWFFTCLSGDHVARPLSGTVTVSSATRLQVRLDNRVVTQATSGSPIIDQSGNVIGMLSGHYESNGELICVPGCAIAARSSSDIGR